MTFLKYCCPFGGIPVISIITSLGVVINSVLTLTKQKTTARLLGIWFLVSIITLLLCHVFTQRLSDDDKANIEEAELPLWEPVTPEILERVRSMPVSANLLTTGIVLLLVTVPFLVIIKLFSYGQDNIYTALFTLLVVINVFLILAGLIQALLPVLWRRADASAMCTKIKINRIIRRRLYTRSRVNPSGSSFYRTYAVCYTAEDRYILRISDDDAFAENIIVVRCGAFITYFTDADNNLFSIIRKTGIPLPVPPQSGEEIHEKDEES